MEKPEIENAHGRGAPLSNLSGAARSSMVRALPSCSAIAA